MLCLHVYLGWFLTGRLAPAPLKKPSLALFLIHSLLACCCFSVSIEAHECCVGGSNGVLLLLLLRCIMEQEFVRVNVSASGVYRLQMETLLQLMETRQRRRVTLSNI